MDNLQFITQSLRDLKSFAKLLQLRRAYVDVHGPDQLQDWVLYGTLLLSKQGPLRALDPFTRGDLPKGLAKVVPLQSLQELLPDVLYGSTDCDPFSEDDRCLLCHGTFQVKDLADVRSQHHGRCFAIQQKRSERTFFESIFLRAGVPAALLEIPNDYWKGSPTPWFRAMTPKGDITIGYRKRVISIEWDRKAGLPPSLEDENVTKDPGVIHAWGEDKAVEYLKAIYEHLKA